MYSHFARAVILVGNACGHGRRAKKELAGLVNKQKVAESGRSSLLDQLDTLEGVSELMLEHVYKEIHNLLGFGALVVDGRLAELLPTVNQRDKRLRELQSLTVPGSVWVICEYLA
jgi:hypothetical protein